MFTAGRAASGLERELLGSPTNEGSLAPSDTPEAEEGIMAHPERCDIVVLGSGEAGQYPAWHMAHAGSRTAVVERQRIGGSCPNTNCLPSKHEIWSAKVADLVRRAAAFGTLTSPGSVEMARVRPRKRAMVEGLIALRRERYRASGTELIMGSGSFVAPKTLEGHVNDGGTRVLTGARVCLNGGTHATIPNIPGLVAAGPLTPIEVLELDRLPEHLIVLGGGSVRLAFAQAYRRVGSRVTVIAHGPPLAGREDPDVADAILQVFRTDGIEVWRSAATLRVQGRSGAHVSLLVRTPHGEQPLAGSDLLGAVGRTPNTAGIGLDTAGVAVDARGPSRSTTHWRPPRLRSGRWGRVPAVPSSPTSLTTTFASSATTWPGATGPRASGSSPSACSPTRRSPGSACANAMPAAVGSRCAWPHGRSVPCCARGRPTNDKAS
jgi:hypothetical protein